jgi:hypothetical protein
MKRFWAGACVLLFATTTYGQGTETLQTVTERGEVTNKNIFLLGTSNGLRLQYGAGSSFWVNTPNMNMLSIGGRGTVPPATGVLNILGNGNVGIGTFQPQAMLAVKGVIFAQKVKVTVNPADWPDYVFQQDYCLLSLAETAKYIEENKHLPGVPSAKEIEKDGLDLGEMNKKLLQKIEELTLHVIQQQKEIEELKTWKKSLGQQH